MVVTRCLQLTRSIDRWSNFSLFLFLFVFLFIYLFCFSRSLTVGKRNDVMQITGEDGESRIVLAKPVSLNGESDVDYTAPNPLQLVLSLFKNVLPGSDLTRFQASQHPPSYRRGLFVIFAYYRKSYHNINYIYRKKTCCTSVVGTHLLFFCILQEAMRTFLYRKKTCSSV